MADPYEELLESYRPIEQLIPADWVSSEIVLADGGMLHYYRTGGNKPPILLIHGFQVDGRMWLRTALSLQEDYDCILVDVRGHGLSSAMPDNFTDHTLVDDLWVLIDSLHLEQPLRVIGHSMGAELAARLTFKTEVNQLILVDPALKNISAMLPPIEDELPVYLTPVVETIEQLNDSPALDRLLLGLSLLPPGTTLWEERDYVSFVEGQASFDVMSYFHANKMSYMVDSPTVIANIPCPTLLLTAKSMMLPPDEFEQAVSVFLDNLQNGRHYHFKDSGHFIPFDQFDHFISTIEGFIQSNH